MKTRTVISMTLTLMVWASCSKNDTPYTPPALAEGTKVAGMAASYDSTVFVDLSTGTLTAVSAVSWDIAIQSTGGKALISNGARKGGVYRIASTNFDSVTAVPATVKINYEPGTLDTTATSFGAWAGATGASLQLVYVVDLGRNPPSSAVASGYKKMRVESATAGTITIRYANLDGSGNTVKTITLDAAKNFTYFSFTTGNVTSVEPDKSKWDFMCAGITVAGGGPPGSYVVTMGVQHNRLAGVKVATDNPGSSLTASDDPAAAINVYPSSNSRYATITKADYTTLGPVASADAIGRSWWQILQPHSSGNYKVYDWKTFLVQDPDGRVFKLKFTAFKNVATGTVGYPAFEYKELQ